MTPREPERLRVSASEVERRALAQAAGELPPPEVIGRVARALGLSATAVDAATRASAANAGVATAKASASAGASLSTAATIPWVSVGVLGVAVAGAIVGAGLWRASASAPAPVTVMPAAPSLAPPPEQNVGEAVSDHGKANAAVTAPAPNRVPSPPTAPRRAREPAPLPDSRAQTLLVDSARNALAAGFADRALVLLGKYREKYPSGIFLPEVVVLRIEALARLGRSTEARTLAARFATDYGEGPLAERARRVADLSKP